jgi:hypothetical protein
MNPYPSPIQEALDAQTAFIRYVNVTATRGTESVALQPESGQLTADVRRSLRWNGNLSIPVDADLVPVTPFDILSPFGTTITVSLGVTLYAGVEAEVAFGVYDLEDSDSVISGGNRVVNLQLSDLGNRLARYRFETPFTIPASTDLADAVNLVTEDRLNISLDAEATGQTTGRKRVLGLKPELDPARELLELAQGFGYRLYFDRNGELVLDQPPAGTGLGATPLAGDLTVANTFRSKPPNVIVVRGETSDGTTPIQAVAMDLDSDSPTWAGDAVGESPYGRVTEFFASPLIVTQAGANQAATNRLASRAGAGATWTVTKAYDPTIDPDDLISVNLDDETVLPLYVDAVTVDIAGATSIECRAVSGLEEL